MAKKKPPTTADETQGAFLPIEWHYPEGQVGQFANQLLIQYDEEEFHISFFEIKPPVVLGSDEEKKKAIASIQSIRAECVARIVVSKGRMPFFVKSLQEHLAKHMPVEKSPSSSTSNGTTKARSRRRK